MNKYVLILPLVILSFFLGYFASNSKMEHVYTIATVTTVLVAIAGCLLFLKHQTAGDSKRTKTTKVPTAFIAVLLFLTLIEVQLVNLVGANFVPFYEGVKPPDANTKPPEVSITSPKNNSMHNTDNVSLCFKVSVGESTTASSTWIHELYYKGDWQENKTYIDLEEFYEGIPTKNRSSSLPPEFSFNLTNIPEGKHSIVVYANEKGRGGNNLFIYWDFFINASTSVNFTIDTISPHVSVFSVENRTYGKSSVPLDFTVNEQTKWIGYSLDEQANITITGNTTLTELPDGSHSLVIYAKDTAGNTAISEPFYFTMDTTLPNISVLTIENKTYDTTDIPLDFTVNEPVSEIIYVLDEQANMTITGNMTLTELSEGSHNLTVYAKDTAGNICASETVYFSIDQTPKLVIWGSSFPMTYGYALAAVIVVSIVAMAGYLFVKRKKLGEGT
jgi:hypothetical protein